MLLLIMLPFPGRSYSPPYARRTASSPMEVCDMWPARSGGGDGIAIVGGSCPPPLFGVQNGASAGRYRAEVAPL